MSAYTNAAPNVDDMELYPTQRGFAQVSETVITTFQSGHGFAKTSANGTVTVNDTTNYFLGSQSIQLTTPTGGQSVFADKTNFSAFDSTGKSIKAWVMADNWQALTECWIYLSIDTSFTARYVFKLETDKSWFKDNNVWYPVTFSFGDATISGSPTRDSLVAVRVRATSVSGVAVNVNFNMVSLVPERAAGVLSITFDDGIDNTFTKAKPVLDKYAYRATCYIETESVGNSGKMTLAQIQQLYKQGWDISGHYQLSLKTFSVHDLQDKMRTIRRWLVDNGFNRSCDHYAYSNGHYNDTQMPIYRKWWRSCRTIAEDGSETYPPADSHRLRILNITESDNTTTVANRVTQAINNKEWLIMVFHGIVDTVTDSSTQTSLTNFTTITDNIATQGIRVMPVSAVVNGDT